MLVIKGNQPELMRMLLLKKADLKLETQSKLSAVHLCAKYGNEEMVKCLLDFQADFYKLTVMFVLVIFTIIDCCSQQI